MTIKRPYLGTVVLGAAVGIILGIKGVFPVPKISVTWQASWIDPGSFPRQRLLRGGEELVLVYLGAWSCPWSNVYGDIPGPDATPQVLIIERGRRDIEKLEWSRDL